MGSCPVLATVDLDALLSPTTLQTALPVLAKIAASSPCCSSLTYPKASPTAELLSKLPLLPTANRSQQLTGLSKHVTSLFQFPKETHTRTNQTVKQISQMGVKARGKTKWLQNRFHVRCYKE